MSIGTSRFACRLVQVFLLIAGVGISMLIMEMPSLGPLRVNPFSDGAIMSVLWCVGLLVWALRATRSHQSRFGLKTLLVIMSAVAIGLVNAIGTMLIMSLVCWAMIFDFGVQTSKSNRVLVWRTLQGLAGLTGLAHATGVIHRSTHL